jgi:hypothetical protein
MNCCCEICSTAFLDLAAFPVTNPLELILLTDELISCHGKLYDLRECLARSTIPGLEGESVKNGGGPYIVGIDLGSCGKGRLRAVGRFRGTLFPLRQNALLSFPGQLGPGKRYLPSPRRDPAEKLDALR